jgi:Peptidase family M49
MRKQILAALVTALMTLSLDAADLQQMTARFAPVPLRVDTSKLSAGDRAALVKLIEAGRVVNQIFLQQLWSGNLALYEKLGQDKSASGKARLDYFWLNKGPWSDLDEHKAFLPGVPERKPPGANFYPENMTRDEFERWAKTLSPEARTQAEGFFSVIRRGADGKLRSVPYSEAYKKDLAALAQDLRDAAQATDNATLKHFLETRAAAFLSNDYYASDVAWMDLDAPLDITIGPYETYNDEVFGYKAAFEAYINIRDDAETAKLTFFGGHMQEVEDYLPIDVKYRNPKIGALSPIRVVNEVFAAGDGDHGVQTAAYNLPNDERVVHEKGSKRVMLKNVQEAKFKSTLEPISKIVLTQPSQGALSFDSFFTHILAHEMSHGIGPHQITVNGRASTPRQELKELYSAIEEAKADVLGLFMLQHFYDRGYLKHGENSLYTTFLASSFRTLRFGLNEAHGKGMALQFNYLTDKGAFVHKGGRWEVDAAKIKGGVRDLAHELLTIEATGDYLGAKRMLDTLGVLRPEMKATLAAIDKPAGATPGAVPVDIRPVFATAEEIAPRQ